MRASRMRPSMKPERLDQRDETGLAEMLDDGGSELVRDRLRVHRVDLAELDRGTLSRRHAIVTRVAAGEHAGALARIDGDSRPAPRFRAATSCSRASRSRQSSSVVGRHVRLLPDAVIRALEACCHLAAALQQRGHRRQS